MKKLLILFVFISTAGLPAFSQEKNTRIFRFNPTQLITSTLSMGYESFNKDLTRSSVFNVGIRYKSEDYFYNYGVTNPNAAPLEPYDYWKGLTASYEYRFYIPSFKKRAPNFINEDYGQSGVYLSPSLRIDYNNHDYDRTYYEPRYNQNPEPSFVKVTNTGKINYLGIMPGINMGVQFNIFQRGFIDLYVGGGLRINSVNEISKERSSGVDYYSNSNTITDLVIKEGVRPNGGITFGIGI